MLGWLRAVPVTIRKTGSAVMDYEPGAGGCASACCRAAGDSVSTFVLKAATEAAADVLADRLIHCETEAARDFYLRLAKFEVGPTDPMHLLLMKDLRRALGS